MYGHVTANAGQAAKGIVDWEGHGRDSIRLLYASRHNVSKADFCSLIKHLLYKVFCNKHSYHRQ